jgi:carbonic anhydrase
MTDTALDAILRANEARCRGDASAAADLPQGAYPFVITCMDPRLVGVLVPALGLGRNPPPEAKFAGAVVRPGDVSGARSVLAAAIFNVATEILVIGHTDCRMGKSSSHEIRSGLSRLGVRPDAFEGQDPAGWLGVFSSESQAVRASVEALRANPRVPPGMPIHGLLFNLDSKRLETIVRGYDAARSTTAAAASASGYVPGPSSLAAPPAPVFGTPGLAPPPFAAGPVPFGASGPLSSGPVSFSSSAPPLSATPFVPPPVPPLPPPPPPTPMAAPVPPPSVHQPADSFPAPRPMEEASPAAASAPPVAPKPRDEGARDKKRKRGKSDSPFDRAHEVLDRMRRDRQ